MLVMLMQHLIVMIPDAVDLAEAYETGSFEDCLFIQRLALFLATFLTNHLKFIEKNATVEIERAIAASLLLMVRVSEVRDDEVFKTCLEFWQHFCKELYNADMKWKETANMTNTFFLGRNMNHVVTHPPQFDDVLHRLRHVMIDRMAKPEEVIIVEDENGEIVREMAKDTEVIAQYKTMRETVIFLTHLNYEDTEQIMLEKLDAQVGQGRFTWHGLNTLCWAIGSISGAMSDNDEKRFLVTVIKDLLRLCEEQRGKDNKAVVASNIMYIVGQYPRFLRAHWKFLKTVVNKLFEFMHEHHPGVQDMACDTFLKIAQKCKRKFMTLQADEEQPFIFQLIADLPHHVSDLQQHQVHSFYESVGTMLSDRGQQIMLSREEVIRRLMSLPNSQWQAVMQRAAENILNLCDDPNAIPNAKELSKILKTNIKVCSSAGPIFTHQLSTIFLDMLNVYHVYSEQIILGVSLHGEISTRWTKYRSMRLVKSDILDLLTNFFEQVPLAEELDRIPQIIMTTFMPPLLLEILQDYRSSPPSARDSRVLSMFATAASTLRDNLTAEIPRIMEAVFEPTLDMITKNMIDYQDHRVAFFKFLKAANEYCFFGLFSITPAHRKLVVDSIVWAFKHTERNISEAGLEILMDLLQKVAQTPDFAQQFYQTFLVTLIQEILDVLTDRLHKSGFKMQATVLKHIFGLVQGGEVVVPLFDSAAVALVMNGHSPAHLADAAALNQYLLKEHVQTLIGKVFPHLAKSIVASFVEGLFNVALDLNAFKQHLRDFLVTLKEFQDTDGLFMEEEEAMRERARREREEYESSVPGLLPSGERYYPDEDM